MFSQPPATELRVTAKFTHHRDAVSRRGEGASDLCAFPPSSCLILPRIFATWRVKEMYAAAASLVIIRPFKLTLGEMRGLLDL